MLGSAFFTVYPDTQGFRTLLDTQVRKSIATVNPNVKVGADTKGADAAILGLQARMKALSDRLGTLRLTADDKQAEATVARLQVRLLALSRQVESITMKADTTKLDAQIATEEAKLAKLRLSMSDLVADANTAQAAAKIANLEKQAADLYERLDNLDTDVDITDALAKIYSIETRLKVLRSNAAAVKLAADSTKIDKDIAATEVKLAGLKAQAGDIQLGADVDVGKIVAAEAALLGIEAASEKAAKGARDVDDAMGLFARGARNYAGVYGLLTGNIKLFGGALEGVLPKALAEVGVIHVLADAAVEIAAVWVPAGIAVAAFGLAAAKTGELIYDRFKNINTVMDATGQAIYPLTNNMRNLTAEIKPQVYQLLGDAIEITSSKTSQFGNIAKQTGTVIDQLAARFTLAVTQGDGVSKFMNNASKDVALLGDSIGNLGGVFANVFKAVPGYAEILLSLGDGITHLLEEFTAAAVPVLKWGLAIHGAILYSGLALTAIVGLAGGVISLGKAFVTFGADKLGAAVTTLKDFGASLVSGGIAILNWGKSIGAAEGAAAKFGAALAPLAENPMLWVTAAAVALGALVYAIVTSTDAAQKFNSTLQQTITNASLSNVVTTIQVAQASTAAKLAQSTQQLNEAIRTNTSVNAGRAGTLNSNGAAIQNLDNATRHYAQGQQQLNSQYQLVTGRVSALSKEYGGNTQALGILNAAGITSAQITDKNSQHWAAALIQVQATSRAYQAMGTVSGQLGDDLDVLGRTVTDQYTAIQKLNQGWQQFITDVTGTQGAFDTVAQGFETLSTHSQDIKLSLGKLKTGFNDAKAGIDSLTGPGIALNQAFSEQVQNIEKLTESWRTAGLSNSLFVAGVKDAIAPMTQYAKGSKEATAQLVALAQEAGYQGPISMAALTKWLGNTGDATKNLKDITNQATEQEALLTGAMQDQGTFISQQLLNDINQAIIAYDGVGKAATAYGRAVAQFGKDSSQAHAAQSTLITDLINAGGAAGDTKNQIAAMIAKVLGIPQSQALKDVTAQLNAATAAAAKTDPSFREITSDFALQHQAATTAAKDLTGYNNVILANGVNSDQASLARVKLVQDMTDAGVKAMTAQHDVDVYTQAVQQNGVNSDAAAGARRKLVTDILDASTNARQGRADLASYTQAVENNGSQSDSAQSARAKLIKDLENAGLSAKESKTLVDGLQTAIDNLHGKNVTIGANATASGSISIVGSGWAAGQGNIRFHSGDAAAGRFIDVGTGPTADDVMARVSKGEYIVKAASVSKYGKPFMDKLNAGMFASGGLVTLGNELGSVVPAAAGFTGTDAKAAVTAGVTEAIAAAKALVQKQSAQASAVSSAGPVGGDEATNAALARKLFPKWAAGADWAAWNYVAMRESGWNRFAENPGSGAYGIPQALPPTKLPLAGQKSGGSHAGPQISWMASYMSGRYGGPQGAAAHEKAFNWYDQGGLLQPGLTLAVNGTGAPEHVLSGQGLSGLAGQLSQILAAIQQLSGILSGGGSGLAGGAGTLAGAGGFGLTRSDLGLPAQLPTDSGSSDTGSGDSGSGDSGSSTPAKPAPKPKPTAAQKAVSAVMHRLMNGYIWHNKLVQARQANSILDYLGDHSYDAKIGQVSFLDGLLETAVKNKNKKAEKAAEKLLANQGVHVWTVQKSVKGNAPQSAAVKKLEALIKTDIKNNNMTLAGQDNSLLTHFGVSKYTGELGQIRHLDALLLKYQKARDSGDVKATETLLGQYGVKKFTGISVPSSGGSSSGGGSSGGSGGSTPVSTTLAQLRSALASGQAAELSAYNALTRKYAADLKAAKAGSFLSGHRASIGSELNTLASRQGAEAAAYHATGGTGLTAGNVSALASRVSQEITVVQDKYLDQGEPSLTSTLKAKLGSLHQVAAQKFPGKAAGGLVMDKGGWLAPGWNPPIWNGTGRPEPVGPAIASGNADIIAELRALRGHVARLTEVTAAGPARTGEHVAAAVNGGAAAASFRARYPGGGA